MEKVGTVRAGALVLSATEPPRASEEEAPDSEREVDYSDLLQPLAPLGEGEEGEVDRDERGADSRFGIELDASAGLESSEADDQLLDVGALLPSAGELEPGLLGDAGAPLDDASGISLSDVGDLVEAAPELEPEAGESTPEDEPFHDLSAPPGLPGDDDGSLWPEPTGADARDLGVSLPAVDPVRWSDPRWEPSLVHRESRGEAIALFGGCAWVGGEALWSFEADSRHGAPRASRAPHAPPARVVALVAFGGEHLIAASAWDQLLSYHPDVGFQPEPELSAALPHASGDHAGYRLFSGLASGGRPWAAALARDGRLAVRGADCPLGPDQVRRLHSGFAQCAGPACVELRSRRAYLSRDGGRSFVPLPGSDGATAVHLAEDRETVFWATVDSRPRVTLFAASLQELAVERLCEMDVPTAMLDEDAPVRALVWDAARRILWMTGALGTACLREPPPRGE